MRVLGIETSCDETGVAVYDSRDGLLGQALHSQIALHRDYGGVVPELASRDHIARVLPLVDDVLGQAGLDLRDLDAIAYTRGPGLAGALLVGAGVAAALAMAAELPLLGVHHLEGHLLSPLLAQPELDFPFVALLVSGGHTMLLRATALGCYEMLGETVDDAAGEAFDKSAKLLGLGYPGGPELARLAAGGRAEAFDLPRPKLHSEDLDFSFAGLKTAVLTRVRQLSQAGEAISAQARADLAAATQEAITDVLAAKAAAALRRSGLRTLVVAGGVGANLRLREKLDTACAALGAQVHYPPLQWCTDNGPMIAYAACRRLQAGLARGSRDYAFDIQPRWDLSELRAC
ncbi:tRNA (adenosine(37)-N6)-threonylcarbamoyltransferase complex transferase subunit TsaD [Thiomonas sp.]|uniref:tRNA (adenosine(37)-N6)-threonylcarbamoyltransferase complex transferase subunit TsaD n=1 Tax=Thiomonas sp. TaxID=2047785 RepID=UPI0026025E0B|nr:tRNA (adenosine(37)-N6)-threonylcarbamoyltransferase complex transferase subunit TsaD [Thiomonas sp.]